MHQPASNSAAKLHASLAHTGATMRGTATRTCYVDDAHCTAHPQRPAGTHTLPQTKACCYARALRYRSKRSFLPAPRMHTPALAVWQAPATRRGTRHGPPPPHTHRRRASARTARMPPCCLSRAPAHPAAAATCWRAWEAVLLASPPWEAPRRTGTTPEARGASPAAPAPPVAAAVPGACLLHWHGPPGHRRRRSGTPPGRSGARRRRSRGGCRPPPPAPWLLLGARAAQRALRGHQGHEQGRVVAPAAVGGCW